MTDDERRAHADVQSLGSAELACDEAARGIAYRFQSLDEKHSDARDEFHNGTHLDSESEYVGYAVDYFGP